MADAFDGPGVGAALDAHFYTGGRQVRRVAELDARDWPIGTLADRVGYGDEVSLQPADWLVEIARLRAHERRVTWIALYRGATDAVLGDRSNYQGVGIWLLDATCRRPDLLLQGLREVVQTLAGEGIERCEAVAREFATPQYLYLEPLRPMPPGLQGWSFSADLLPTTAVFQASAAADPWSAVAEQVSRVTVLPAATPDQARSLILVTPSPVAGVEQLPRTLATDLLAQLPPALADAAAEMANARRDRDASAAEVSGLTGRLNEAEATATESRAKIAQLERQIEENDVLKRLKAIDDQLARIQESTRRVDLALPDLKRSAGDQPLPPRPAPRAQHRSDLGTQRAQAGDSWEPYLIGAIATLFVVGFLALLYYIFER